ncbi:hypothetical protein VY93_00995 [Mycoplasmopsis synoviae ATCC 25204]|uniref:Uncharacterized protein n=1 Tax=Mycoplasmopsis synoviae TaxID=2109 RepID=A0A3B0PGU9_MYCSY|nr:hypothetical protein VY93_00995 [Mycoplasmopsis synoviae ATCC 25204]SYV92634.1 Uncharacterised protein [Mycoplasmopsis synoviae]
MHKVKKRVIIDTQGDKHYYNLGVYYIREIKNGKEKRIYFTHYYHDYLKQVRRNKYSIETKTFAIFPAFPSCNEEKKRIRLIYRCIRFLRF